VHLRRVGDGLLVPHLGAGRVQVRDVCALIEGGDLEGAARPRRALLEDQRDLFARQPLHLVAGVLGRLEGLRERGQMQELVARPTATAGGALYSEWGEPRQSAVARTTPLGCARASSPTGQWGRRSKPAAASSTRPAGEPRSGGWRIWPI
jgi:hypothetical protein